MFMIENYVCVCVYENRYKKMFSFCMHVYYKMCLKFKEIVYKPQAIFIYTLLCVYERVHMNETRDDTFVW